MMSFGYHSVVFFLVSLDCRNVKQLGNGGISSNSSCHGRFDLQAPKVKKVSCAPAVVGGTGWSRKQEHGGGKEGETCMRLRVPGSAVVTCHPQGSRDCWGLRLPSQSSDKHWKSAYLPREPSSYCCLLADAVALESWRVHYWYT
jgi:hypothetical protein